jgi:hypothetical protein
MPVTDPAAKPSRIRAIFNAGHKERPRQRDQGSPAAQEG